MAARFGFGMFTFLFCLLAACGPVTPDTDSDVVAIHDGGSDQVTPPDDGVTPTDAATDDGVSNDAGLRNSDLPLTGFGSTYVAPDPNGPLTTLRRGIWTGASNSSAHTVDRIAVVDMNVSAAAAPSSSWTLNVGMLWMNWEHQDTQIHCWSQFKLRDGSDATSYESQMVACFSPGVDPRGMDFNTAMSIAIQPSWPQQLLYQGNW